VPSDQVAQQVNLLREEGFKEIILTGINIGQYQDPSTETDLAGLLRQLTQIPGEFRLRLTSLDPLEVTPDLIQAVAESNGKIAPHFHLSAQSADDTVLKLMARRHHVNAFEETCHAIMAAIPQAAIGGDIIVGFPGETDEHFHNTLEVLSRIPFHYIHVFRYSPRPGTPAADVRPQVPEHVRKTRANQLIQLADQKAFAFKNSLLGQRVTVLVEAEQELDLFGRPILRGLSENYLKVRLDPNAGLEPNQFVSVTLSHLLDNGEVGGTLAPSTSHP
jgi:threonylcarbamoyladenosine tRNA methylthiotransferase MtaB